MTSSKIILTMTVILALCAGVVGGRLSSRLQEEHRDTHVGPPPSGHGPNNWMSEQLKLSADQKQQMDSIWNDTKPKIEKTFERQQLMDRERDEAIADLLGPAQWAAYSKLINDFRARRKDIDSERADLFKDANERSRALLNDDQKKAWDEFSRGGRDRRHGGRGSSTKPSSTQPA